MDFHPVEQNLREMFRALADRRPAAEVREGAGISIICLRAAFQMFNAVFLSAPVDDEMELQERINAGANFMQARGLLWSLWICEDWLAPAVRRKTLKLCARNGLHLASEMPGMMIERLTAPTRSLPELSMRRVESERDLRPFCEIGATCFHVPRGWFEEVFDHRMPQRRRFDAWTGYWSGEPVATAATVVSGGVIGLYNIAVLPGFQQRGFAEYAMRHAILQAKESCGLDRVILQSTRQAITLYNRLGFAAVTRFSVFTS